MKIVAAGLAILLLAAGAAEANGKKAKLPKPIDSPIVRPKVREDHKPIKRLGRHPKQTYESRHGNEWDKIFNMKTRHGIPSYLYQE
jgi:hypothetical protein